MASAFTDGAEVSDHEHRRHLPRWHRRRQDHLRRRPQLFDLRSVFRNESPYLLVLSNSPFFNGTAKPQLEFSAPATQPQNGTSTIQAELKNIGGSTAVNVNNTTVVRELGFSYVSTTSGPTPSVSGQTLTWPNLGEPARRPDRRDT